MSVDAISLFACLFRVVVAAFLRLTLWGSLVWALWLSLGCVLQSPAEKPVGADAVVMLGGGDRFRFDKALELIRDGYADTLMLSHPVPGNLKDAALFSVKKIFFRKDSNSSWNEAQEMRHWMEKNNIRHVLVVSDPPHLLRLAYTWFSVFRGSGLSYTFVASEPSWWSAWRWWDNEFAALFAGTEVLKLGYYLVRYRFGWSE